MFEFKVKGRTLEDAKTALQELVTALQNEKTFVKNVTVTKISQAEPEVVHNEEEFTPDNMIGKSLAQAPVDMNDLDAEGQPWDSRIHSSGRTKYKKDNTWTLKRGVTDEEAAKVKAENRGTVSSPAMTQHYVQATDTTIYKEAPKASQMAVVTPPPTLPTMNSGHTVDTFVANFPLVLGNLITEKKVSQDYINELKKYFMVAEIWMITDAQKAQVFDVFVENKIITKVG